VIFIASQSHRLPHPVALFDGWETMLMVAAVSIQRIVREIQSQKPR
jgi:hypothetical protein